MQLPLQITFRNLDRSEAIEASISEHAAKLEKYCDQIMGCRVVIEAPHKHHQHGNHYHVRIDVTAPDAELVANREPDEHHAYTMYMSPSVMRLIRSAASLKITNGAGGGSRRRMRHRRTAASPSFMRRTTTEESRRRTAG